MRTAPSFAEALAESTYKVPESEFDPLKTSVPAPLLVKPLAPASGAATVAVFAITMDGEDELLFNVNTLPPELVSTQFCVPPVSPNFNVPMLRDASSVTVRSADLLTKLK